MWLFFNLTIEVITFRLRGLLNIFVRKHCLPEQFQQSFDIIRNYTLDVWHSHAIHKTAHQQTSGNIMCAKDAIRTLNWNYLKPTQRLPKIRENYKQKPSEVSQENWILGFLLLWKKTPTALSLQSIQLIISSRCWLPSGNFFTSHQQIWHTHSFPTSSQIDC